MKVTVFGGSGFLGSHVADALTDAGHKVVIFDKEKSAYLRAGQEMIIGDILDDTENLRRSRFGQPCVSGLDGDVFPELSIAVVPIIAGVV